MNIRVLSWIAQGTVHVPPSKSMAHRLLICAGMCEGESVVRGISDCEDVQATLDCLRAVGAECTQCGDIVTVRGVDFRSAHPNRILNCRESGSTLRFLIPPLLLSGGSVTFEGQGRLMERPMTVYETLFRERGLTMERVENRLTVSGRLTAGKFVLAGNVSSQFVSGMLFALPMADGDSTIELIPPVESRSYILMTVDAMRQFGADVEWDGDHRLHIRGGWRYSPLSGYVESDYSNAAFTDAFNCFGGNVKLEGLRADSLQGDRCYKEAMQKLCQGHATVSLKDCPDLGPSLFAVAAAKHGGVFTETARLRIKESDRVETMRQELEKFGVQMTVEEDRVEIMMGELKAPKSPLLGHNDHRIVMALTVLLTLTGGELHGAEAVRKSYPAFFDDLRSLGLRIEEILPL